MCTPRWSRQSSTPASASISSASRVWTRRRGRASRRCAAPRTAKTWSVGCWRTTGASTRGWSSCVACTSAPAWRAGRPCPAILGWMAEAQLMAGRFVAASELTQEASTGPRRSAGRAVSRGRSASMPSPWRDWAGWTKPSRRPGRSWTPAAVDPEVGLDGAPARLALGIAALSRGQLEQAVAHLRTLDQLKREAGIREPRLCAHAGGFHRGAGRRRGSWTRPTEVLARLDEEAASSGGQWSLAAAARCRAMVLAAHGRPGGCHGRGRSIAGAVRGSADAVRERQNASARRSAPPTEAGEGARPRRRCARPWRPSRTCSTPVWAERARSELARIPDHQSAGSLTPTEETVARLAAEGLTNREIAERTFLSPKTVEVNLTRVYRKLGVRRAALANRLAETRGVAHS